VILHPPIVAVKLFAVGAEKPELWLAAHLSEISPPGNRRDLALAYQAIKGGQVAAVFARKSELRSLLTKLQGAGLAIHSIVPAALLALEVIEESADAERDAGRFVLCQYRVGIVAQVRALWVETPDGSGSQDAREHTATTLLKFANRVHTESSRCRRGFVTLDFLPQFGLPRALPTRDLLRAIRLTSSLLLALVIAVTGLWATQLVSGNAEEDLRLQESYRALDETQKENAELEKAVERLDAMRSVRVDLPRWFSTISRAVPANCWLGSLQLRAEAEGAEVVFALSGYSREESEPQAFAAALRQGPGIAMVTLERVSRSETPTQAENSALTHAAVFRFEMTGRYSDAK